MPFDIILFAAIAAFFFWKLRGTLGTRNGEERQRDNPFAPRPDLDKATDEGRSAHNVGPDTVIDSTARDVPLGFRGALHPETSVAGGIAQLRAIDPAFDEKAFLASARQAYTMIVDAFAAGVRGGDKQTLKMLLTPAIYDAFVSEIDARAARGEQLSTSVKRILVAEVSAARTDGNRGIVAVDFTSEQISVTKNSTGEVVDGDAVQPVEVAEAWIFERDLASRDPAWHLVATKPL